MSETYWLPNHSGFLKKEDLLWINFTAKKFDSQSGYGRGSNTIRTSGILGSWNFLASLDISETVQHQWGDYESMGSRIADKVGQFSVAVGQAGAVAKGVKAGYNTFKDEASLARAAATTTATMMGAENVPKYKIDKSYVYQNSEKRKYMLTFNLGYYNDPEKEIFTPIRELEKLSCAQMGEGLIGIEYPALFSISSSPFELIQINYAALETIQTTWKTPFKNGVPTSCEVSLTFTDIEPLYRKSWGNGSVIRVADEGDIERGEKGR